MSDVLAQATGPVSHDAVDEFLQHALRGDVVESTDVALSLLDHGVPEEVVVGDLLAVAQREVGEQWERNVISVADEHLATGSSTSALHALAGASRPHDRDRPEGRVLVTCAEGDWHAIAAHMLAERLRARGHGVVFLGASTPAEHVAGLLERQRHDALVISCNLPIFFNGVVRLVEAAHRAGVPVLAGGRACGAAPARALRLGADAWAADLATATNILHDWQDGPTGRELRDPARPPATATALEREAPVIVELAMETLAHRIPAMASYRADQLARTREDLVFILQFLVAADQVSDDAVFVEFVRWLAPLLAVRGVPADVLPLTFALLAPLVGPVSGPAARLLDESRAALEATSPAAPAHHG